MSLVSGGSGGGAVPVGVSSLIYRYTVAGVDKVAIDTTSDASQAGSNDWTNGDALEVLFVGRTDEAAFVSQVNVTVNNDAGAKYGRALVSTAAGGTPVQAVTAGGNSWGLSAPGASAAAGAFGSITIFVPGYMNVAGWRVGTVAYGNAQDATLGHYAGTLGVVSYQDVASAISRVAITPNTGGAKLKVGSELLVYKRTAA
jgi:hypothetical protein